MRVAFGLSSVIAIASMGQIAVAQAQEEWLGMFTTDTVDGCAVRGTSELVTHVAYGYGRYGDDFEYGVLADAANGIQDAANRLRDYAREMGKNAVIGVRIVPTHSSDAVFESGQNWRIGDQNFDYTASYMNLVYGTAVNLDCR